MTQEREDTPGENWSMLDPEKYKENIFDMSTCFSVGDIIFHLCPGFDSAALAMRNQLLEQKGIKIDVETRLVGTETGYAKTEDPKASFAISRGQYKIKRIKNTSPNSKYRVGQSQQYFYFVYKVITAEDTHDVPLDQWRQDLFGDLIHITCEAISSRLPNK